MYSVLHETIVGHNLRAYVGKINLRMKVGIWLHYDDMKAFLGFDDAKMLEEHKAFLYPAVEILSSGWCFDNNIFCVPFLRARTTIV